MPGNDAVLFFSETHVVEVKEIIMSGVFSADAEGALWLPFHWLRLGSTGGLWERTGVETRLGGASAPDAHTIGCSSMLGCPQLPFLFCVCVLLLLFFLTQQPYLLGVKAASCHSFIRL